jgi:two-component system chemotaxis response regulator CheY
MQNHKHVPILIADDEPLMRQLLAAILRDAGYVNLQYAQNGQQALTLLSAGDCSFGIAFLDIDMPGFSGLEVMRMANAERLDCVFVIVSAHSSLGNVLAALKDGARGFIVKPYTPQQIHNIVTKYESEVSA